MDDCENRKVLVDSDFTKILVTGKFGMMVHQGIRYVGVTETGGEIHMDRSFDQTRRRQLVEEICEDFEQDGFPPAEFIPAVRATCSTCGDCASYGQSAWKNAHGELCESCDLDVYGRAKRRDSKSCESYSPAIRLCPDKEFCGICCFRATLVKKDSWDDPYISHVCSCNKSPHFKKEVGAGKVGCGCFCGVGPG